MDKGRKLISIVVPAYNEVDNVEVLHREVTRVMEQLAERYDHELVIVDDHSTDGTFETLQRLVHQDPRIRVFRLSRNFGFQAAVHTAYTKARGDAAIQLDADLQDPPELILSFVDQWEKGFDVVYGVRRTRQEGRLITKLRQVAYRVINALSEDELPLDAGDCRLVDRRILDEIVRVQDSRPYLRGTIASLGFNQIGVPYDRAARERGESKFPLRRLVHMAIDGILNHSVVPLRISAYVGLTVSLVTVLSSIVYIVGRIGFGKAWPAGFATTTVLLLLSLSLNALFLGIIGEYLGRIYQQVRRRPLSIIQHEITSDSFQPFYRSERVEDADIIAAANLTKTARRS
jgi:dolichol-phosphate mannosyltransferase